MPPAARRLAAILIAVLVLLQTAPAGAQPSATTSGTVEGDVTSPACRPVEGATVAIAETSTVTTSSGAYELEGIAPGPHELVVSPPSPRYETATVAVEVAAGATTAVPVVLPYAAATVTRVAGPTRTDTAVAASQRAYPDGTDAVVLASSGAFPDALAAAPLAASVAGPLLLVDARTGPAVLAEVRRLAPDDVVVVGAVNAVMAVVQAELDAEGFAVRRIAGEDRFDTAALVAREAGLGESGEVALATGETFADALSFAPLAAAQQIPILLTGHDELPGDTAAALDELAPDATTVLGGTAVISDAVAASVPGAARVGGATRFQTSAAIARLGLDRGLSAEVVAVATGAGFADALAAGPVADRDGGPLVLVDGLDAENPDAQGTYTFLADQLDDLREIVVYGGRAVVSEQIATLLATPASQADTSACADAGAPALPPPSPKPTPTPDPTPDPTIGPSENSRG